MIIQTKQQPRSIVWRVIKFIGSVQLAVPVLVLVAIALAWGTYLESTSTGAQARATVYGSWWFVGLMVLVCLSLIFAVVTRYPWKRKHVGFITVHGGLVLLIFGSFWSMWGRVEGHLTLEEGKAGDEIETEREVLELARFNMGQSTTLGSVNAPRGKGSVSLGAMAVEVVDRWDNCSEEPFVADDAKEPLRAIEISGNPTASEGDWVAEEAKAGGAPTLEGMTIRVLPDGASWTPPAAPVESTSGYVFIAGDVRVPVGEAGSEPIKGWKITSLKKYASATVNGGTISEGTGEKNPAIEITLDNGTGTVERHTSFEHFPDMVLTKTLKGNEKSGLRLAPAAAQRPTETLVVFGPIGATRFGYINAAGVAKEVISGPLPVVLELGSHRVKVIKQFGHARSATRFVQAPSATDRRPALVLRVPGKTEPVVLAWKAFEPVDGNSLLRYGPEMVRLPFTVRLKEFRKADYPGTEMAMSYESDVVISAPGQPDVPYLIHMNTPYASGPWKAYQSGFIGDKITVLSVMRDPGLPLTYVGSIALCVGIFMTFFMRSLSWGHPGIPAPSLVPERKGTYVPVHEKNVSVAVVAGDRGVHAVGSGGG